MSPLDWFLAGLAIWGWFMCRAVAQPERGTLVGSRDHSIECEVCGMSYGGFNGPETCDRGAEDHSDVGTELAALRAVGDRLQSEASRLAAWCRDKDMPISRAAIALAVEAGGDASRPVTFRAVAGRLGVSEGDVMQEEMERLLRGGHRLEHEGVSCGLLHGADRCDCGYGSGAAKLKLSLAALGAEQKEAEK